MRAVILLLRPCLAVLLIFCLIAYLASALAAIATDSDRMLQKMNAYSDTTLSSVSSEEYPALAISLTDYLKGKADTAQIELIKNGQKATAFSAKELMHLEDIKGLISFTGTLRYTALIFIFFAMMSFFIIRKKAPEFLKLIKPQRTMSITLYSFFAVSIALLVWGLVDFNSLFYTFHMIAFKNDLWLLDPRQDLLLQLMPSDFFLSYGQDLIKNSMVILLSLPLAAYAFMRAGKDAV